VNRIVNVSDITLMIATDGTTRFCCKCVKPAGHLLCGQHAQEVGKRMLDSLNQSGVMKT
jgi:hypothetical protein